MDEDLRKVFGKTTNIKFFKVKCSEETIACDFFQSAPAQMFAWKFSNFLFFLIFIDSSNGSLTTGNKLIRFKKQISSM